jgi:hypothetical protein
MQTATPAGTLNEEKNTIFGDGNEGNESTKLFKPLPPPGPGNFPEGGARAWSVVAGAMCVSFCTFGYMNAYG